MLRTKQPKWCVGPYVKYKFLKVADSRPYI